MKQQPVLISLSLAAFGLRGWHIMPLVDITDESLVLLNRVEANGKKITKNITKAELIRIHNEYEGGDDVAYLDDSQ